MSESNERAAGRVVRLGWLLLALLCTFGLFDHSLWSGNDAREGAMIREMTREGVWVTPVFNGDHYREKPPLLHWTGVLICRLAGGVNEGLVRLPAALYGFGSLVLMGLWARAMGRGRAGLVAAFLCATSALFFEYSRIVLTDAALTFMVTLSLFLFWRARPGRWLGRVPGSVGELCFVLVSALAFYAKGLIGPGLVWVTVSAALLGRGEWRRLARLAALFAAAFVLVLTPWVWALARTGGWALLRSVFWDNQFGRFLPFSDPALPLDPYFVHKEPVWFYLTSLPVRMLPWTLLAVPALAGWFRPRSRMQGDTARFLRMAAVAMLALLHLSAAKAACYAMPLFPVLFLMIGLWLDDRADRRGAGWERVLVEWTYRAVWLVVMGVSLAYLGALLLRSPRVWAPGPASGGAGLVLSAAGLVLAALVAAWGRARLREDARDEVWRAAPALLAIIGVLGASAWLPLVEYHRSYEPLAQEVREARAAGRRMAVAGRRERDVGALMFYLDDRLPALSLKTPGELTAFLYDTPGPAGLVVARRNLTRVKVTLTGQPYRLEPVPHAGQKSGEFQLLCTDPVE